MRIGILALQGGVEEHVEKVRHLGHGPVLVRSPDDLDVDGLIMPGGESTAIGKLLRKTGLDKAIKEKATGGLPVWGSCAGAILLARSGSEYCLGILPMAVERNAYGRQRQSFTATLGTMPAVFIRAPIITSCDCEVLAEHDGNPVWVLQGNVMATTFHPELTDSTAVHEYFLEMVRV